MTSLRDYGSVESVGAVVGRNGPRKILSQVQKSQNQIIDDSSPLHTILIRNVVLCEGRCCLIGEIGAGCFERAHAHLVCIAQNVNIFKVRSVSTSKFCFCAFEFNSGLELAEKDTLAFLRGLRSIYFPNQCFTLGQQSCEQWETISTVYLCELSEGTPQIRWFPQAFARSSSLASICIPSCVRSIYESCFESCLSLCDIHFESPSTLERIDRRASLLVRS
jgi:hypothetical protein